MSLYIGTIRMVSEDALYIFGKILFLFITIPLFLFWILLGSFVELGNDVVAAISGPAYFIIPIFAMSGFKSLLPTAVGMGSTRTELLKVFYGVGIVGVTITIFCLNILQQFLVRLYDQLNVQANILHPGTFFNMDYTFWSYFLIDLLFGIFLFCFTFLLFSLYYRLGLKKSIVTLMILTITGLLLIYSNTLKPNHFEWIWNHSLSDLTVYFIILLISFAALFTTFPILKHAPLKPKTKKE